MKVLLAKKAGFCMGVRRAVETTLETVQHSDERIATFGPLIHNPQVLHLLRERGVDVLNKIPTTQNGTVIIRAHGVPPHHKEQLIMAGAKVKDATCPRVMKVQAIIKKHKKQGCATVIIGDKNHAEVTGLMGYAAPDVFVVSSGAEVEHLRLPAHYIIVSQTTQDDHSFQEISAAIMARFPGGKSFNTICDSTHKRQNEVRVLCEQVDAMVVVGGQSSANTQRLGEIAIGMKKPVFMCESEVDLNLKDLRQFDVVGVTAGASTPTWMINRVIRQIEAIPGRQEGLFTRLILGFVWFMLMSNLYVSAGGGLMAGAISVLCNGISPWAAFTIAFGYLFAMHNINRFSDVNAKKLNDPVMEGFCRRFCRPILLLAGIVLVIAAGLVWQLGMVAFSLFCLMSILGVSYGSHILPPKLAQFFRIKGLKEIPGSKTFLVALAWALVLTLPCWAVLVTQQSLVLFMVFFVLGVIYIRNALFDVFDVQGDKMVGKETLPVCIGASKTLLILTRLLFFIAVLTIIGAVLLQNLSLLLLLPGLFFLWIFIRAYQREDIMPGLRSTFLLESILYILAASLWSGTFLF